MKKVFLTALLATTMVAGPVAAQDNLLMLSNQSIGGVQQSFAGSASLGISYTYRFGADKQEEYGTLNIRNFNGQNVPVVNFSSMGTKPSQFMLTAVSDRENLRDMNWLYIVAGAAVLAGGVMLLNGDRDQVCIEYEYTPDNEGTLIRGKCIQYS